MAGLATQEFLEKKDIREGVLVLKNNAIRGILMVSSINFALKSDEEQSAIIYAFQSFLNSLDFLKTKKEKEQQMKDDDFQRCKSQLWQRMEFLAMGLRRCGLEAIPLTTPELIELFWSIHHPEQAEVGYYPEILPELLK